MAQRGKRTIPQPPSSDLTRTTSTPDEPLDDFGHGIGFWGSIRLQVRASILERATNAQVRMLGCQTRLVSARSTLEQARWEALRLATHAELEANSEEYELTLRSAIWSSPEETVRNILGHETEVERLLAQRESHRAQRRLNAAQPTAQQPADQPTRSTQQAVLLPAITVAVNPDTAKQLAVRALARFAQLPPDQAERRWAEFEREVAERLPRLEGELAIRHARELRGLL